MIFYGTSDVGKIRKNNEDSYYVKSYDDTHMLAIVADGMGGHNGGKQASAIAVESIVESFRSHMPAIFDYPPRKIKHTLLDIVKNANEKVYNSASENPELTGMGTTVVVCYISNDKLYAANVGDSRLYVINDKITQITKDHSLIGELLELGIISETQAMNHPKKNIITKAVGSELSVEPDIYSVNFKKNDVFLLCTDGLTNMIDNDNIISIVNSDCELSECVETLIEEAKKNGGNDNITVVVIKFDEEVGAR